MNDAPVWGGRHVVPAHARVIRTSPAPRRPARRRPRTCGGDPKLTAYAVVPNEPSLHARGEPVGLDGTVVLAHAGGDPMSHRNISSGLN